MEDQAFCFKSVLLPALSDPSAVLKDSSLALPAEGTILRGVGGPSESHPGADRSLRVQQQVQLTLARRGKRSTAKGGVHAQRSLSWSADHRDGLSNTSMLRGGVGSTLSKLPLTSTSARHDRRPSRRVEVSPLPSPQLPHGPRVVNGCYYFYGSGGSSPAVSTKTNNVGAYTVPGPWMAPLVERSVASGSLKRYAFSEAPRGSRFRHTATAVTYSAQARPGPKYPPVIAASNVNANGVFRTPGDHRYTSTPRRRATTAMPGVSAGQGWPAGVRKELSFEEAVRSNHAPSVVSMDVDAVGVARVAPPPPPPPPVQQLNIVALKSEPRAPEPRAPEPRALEPRAPELTLERAVSLLTTDNEDTLVMAASFVQKQCFNSTDAKKMVFYLHGIPKLLRLLPGDGNDNEEVQRAVAGALRNLVYQNNDNKMEVKEHQGVALALRTLRRCRDVETRRQLTGLLWNLSSHDQIKEHLCREGFSVLTDNVLVPCSGLSEGDNPKAELLADADTFHNATGCLRNLSSAGPDSRKAMRDCENLIDSLVYYIRGTIADYKPDDKSTENCVCVLHNLSYEIESELPQKYFKELSESHQNLNTGTGTSSNAWSPGCFAHRSTKSMKALEHHCPLLEEKANPRGVEWLWSAITVRMYLSLMARSVCNLTQEAALGALQNITAGHGMVTEAICYTVVRRESGLQQVRKMLQEGERSVKRTAVSLVRNLSRYRELHPDIVKQVLPELVAMLPNVGAVPAEESSEGGSSEGGPADVTVVLLCHVLVNFAQNETQSVKAIVNHGALPKVIHLSTKDNGYGPTRAAQAACILLHSMWKHSDLHGAYRKAGYRKSDFINSRTTKVVNSSLD